MAYWARICTTDLDLPSQIQSSTNERDMLEVRADTAICPSTQGAEVSGYKIYCDHVVDPVDAADTIVPARTDIANVQGCLTICDSTDGCTGVSYLGASTTCYLHTGASKTAAERKGWDGAVKIGAITQSSTASSGASATASALPVSNISSSTRHGLAPGAKAGIAIGAIAGMTLIVTAVIFLLRRQNGKNDEPSGIQRLLSRRQETRAVSQLRAQLLSRARHDKDDDVQTVTVALDNPVRFGAMPARPEVAARRIELP